MRSLIFTCLTLESDGFFQWNSSIGSRLGEEHTARRLHVNCCAEMAGVPQLDLPDQADESAVQDFLYGARCTHYFAYFDRQILDEHRRNCERQGNYVEAEIAKNRLMELRQQYVQGYNHV